MGLPVAKAHAYGNDFLLVPGNAAPAFTDREYFTSFARTLCDRHHGVGADGLIL